MVQNLKKLIKSFKYAFNGIILCIKNERNFRIHIVIMIYTICIAKALNLNRLDFAILFLTFGSVIAMEAVNTAIEEIVDIVSPNKNPLASIAKDVAAGAVLINAVISILVGICLMWKPDKLINLIKVIANNPLYIVMILLSIIVAIFFILDNNDTISNKN